jgi:hypothetical protein
LDGVKFREIERERERERERDRDRDREREGQIDRVRCSYVCINVVKCGEKRRVRTLIVAGRIHSLLGNVRAIRVYQYISV